MSIPRARLGLLTASLGCALLLVGCGRTHMQPDAGVNDSGDTGDTGLADTGIDTGRADTGIDSSLADSGTLGCRSDRDCVGDPLLPHCDYDGSCTPALCLPVDRFACPEPLTCVRRLCLPPPCPACSGGTSCDPATGRCVPPTSAVSCRAMGGMYVRARCMLPDHPEPACGGGYASEPLAVGCDIPEIPGANFGGVSTVRVGPFPVTRATSPEAGTLVAHQPWRSDDPYVWQFDYVDSSVVGAAVTVTLHLSPSLLGPYVSAGCIRPGEVGFAPQPLCAELPPNSDLDCGEIPIGSIARDVEGRLALAGRNDMGKAHFELWDREPLEGLRRRILSYYTPEPSELWRPLVIGADAEGAGALFVRVGSAGPLGLVELTGSAPYARFLSDAGLSAGGEFVGWPSGAVAARRDRDGALLVVSEDLASELLAPSGAPLGRYRIAPGRVAQTLLTAQADPSPTSTFRVYRGPSGSGAASVELLAEVPDLGPAAAVSTVGDLVWLFAAVPHATGGFTVDRIRISRRGDPPLHTPLVTSEDVGGEIVEVTDLALEWQTDSCGGDRWAKPLLGVMLTIRQADDSVVRELWATSIVWT